MISCLLPFNPSNQRKGYLFAEGCQKRQPLRPPRPARPHQPLARAPPPPPPRALFLGRPRHRPRSSGSAGAAPGAPGRGAAPCWPGADPAPPAPPSSELGACRVGGGFLHVGLGKGRSKKRRAGNTSKTQVLFNATGMPSPIMQEITESLNLAFNRVALPPPSRKKKKTNRNRPHQRPAMSRGLHASCYQHSK